MKRYARVVLTHPSLVHHDRIFTYSIPQELVVSVGSVVRVPLARSKTSGVVIEIVDEPDVARTVPITALAGPGLPPDVVELAMIAAERYLSSPGEALASALPPRVAAVEQESERVLSRSRASADDLSFLRGWRGESLLVRALRGHKHAGFSLQPPARSQRGPMIASLVAASDRAAIVILPDVRIRTDVTRALEDRFGEEIAWIGSDRPNRARYRDWLALRDGSKRIAVGGRSAVFAPVENLGLVIVDDESHVSHKEKRAPRFHARTLAAERARRGNAILIAVGVPPSVEVAAAIESRSLTLVAPPREIMRAERSSIEVVEPSANVPSARGTSAIMGALGEKRKAIVLTHRAGPEAKAILDRCVRVCRPKHPAQLSARTSEPELRKLIKTSDLIVTTSVLAKDLMIENVGVLVICHADAISAHTDFRASEEMFSTWWRLARLAPHIVLESSDPNRPAVRALVRWDPNVLCSTEIAIRKELSYPPFGALVRISVPLHKADVVVKEIEDATPSAQILGPLEHDAAAIIAVRFTDRKQLVPQLSELARSWRASDSEARIDVDPREIV